MADPQDTRAQWLKALGAIVAVAAVIGAVLGCLTYGAVRATGLAGGDDPADQASSPHSTAARLAAAEPSTTSTPTPKPTHRASSAGAEAAKSKTRPHAENKTRKPARHHAKSHPRRHARHRAGHGITLRANPGRVHRMGRVNLWGRFAGHGGTRLIVQRLDNGRWDRFPVTVVVHGGRFRTWVESGRRGPNRFRVVAAAMHTASPPVTVVVR